MTTGPVAQLGIAAEGGEIVSDGEDVGYVNVCVKDADGNVVPATCDRVTFSVEGPGVLVATDNGDETNMEDFRRPSVPVFNGWAQAIVRARPGSRGTLRVVASADGCAPVSVEIAVRVPFK